MTIGFLHTAEVHRPTFEKLVRERSSDRRVLHRVSSELLERAQSEGSDAPGVVAEAQRLTQDLVREGAELVVCTCSTLGAVVEALPTEGRFRTLRIDRPMAERATSRDGRILVLAAVESTRTPTLSLLEAAAHEQGTEVELLDGLCPAAWTHFLGGRVSAYLATLARFVRERARDANAVVLAQATMADLPRLCPEIELPFFTSPRSGVEVALAMLDYPAKR